MTSIELPPPGRPRRGLGRAGLTGRQRRWFDVVVPALVALFATGWVVATVHALRTGAPRPGLAANVTANPLSPSAPPPAPFLLDAALRGLLGTEDVTGVSGGVRVIVQAPGEVPALPDTVAVPEAGSENVAIEYVGSGGDTLPSGRPLPAGVWNVLLRTSAGIREVPGLTVLSAVPLTERSGTRMGTYLVGRWPHEDGSRPRSAAYAPPRGMIRVTQDMLDLPVSRHFRLRHFVTKGQDNVWPKYVLMSPRLLDKLELTIDELNRSGVRVERVGVISGFRTPHYNAGGGDTSGRGSASRHMYGDAMDWFVDNNGDGRMDDLNGDGRIDAEDGRVIVQAAERVERRYPDLIGGIGLYRPTGAHSGFVHIDTRGYRARW